MEKQPAKQSYFFGKGYQDLSNTIRDSWQRNLISVQDYLRKTKEYWNRQENFWKLVALFFLFAAVSVMVFGSLFFLALSAIHIVILATFFSVIYLSFSMLWGIDKLYRLRRRIFTACPSCHHKSELPYYYCPHCGSEHTMLIPSSYGIWKRTCQCGHQLPTTFLNGRNNLTAKCPKCKYDLQAKEATPICIPIVGGPSVGKTCFLFAAIHELVEEIAPKKFWEIRFLDQYNENIYQKMAKDFKAGILPTKTTTGIPVAFNFLVGHPQWSPEKILYFYDAAGESFQASDILATHQFYNYFHGIIFLIDPFSIPEFVLDYQTRVTALKTAIRPSDMRLEDAFETMILNLEKNFNVNRRQRIKQPCAIVINKVDVFDLEERIGEKAAHELMKQEDWRLSSEEAIDNLCRAFLAKCGLEHFVRKVHHKFEQYKFFSSSALGHLPDGTAFHFHKTSKPVMWLLKNIDKELI